jgi:hypothetical protein
MRLTQLLSSLALAASLAACSGGDDGGGSSGVDSSKTLDQVSDSEAMSLCVYFNAQLSQDDIHTIDCYAEGIFQTEGDCQTIADECLAMPADTADDCSDVTAGDLPACANMVTVGEMEACFNAQSAQLSGFADDVSCSSSQEDFQALQELPSACQTVQSKCPDLFN